MEKKVHYDAPKFEVISFGKEDVIRTSIDPNEGPVVGGSNTFNLF